MIMLVCILTVLSQNILMYFIVFFFFKRNGFLSHNQCKLELIFPNIIKTFVSLNLEELVPINVYFHVLSIGYENIILTKRFGDFGFVYIIL